MVLSGRSQTKSGTRLGTETLQWSISEPGQTGLCVCMHPSPSYGQMIIYDTASFGTPYMKSSKALLWMWAAICHPIRDALTPTGQGKRVLAVAGAKLSTQGRAVARAYRNTFAVRRGRRAHKSIKRYSEILGCGIKRATAGRLTFLY